MGKKIAKHHRIGRSITAALLVFSLGVGLSLTLSASAVTLNLPADTATQSGTGFSVRDMQSGGSNFGGGINLGPSSPSGTPGASTTQPVPQFSLINTPAIINDDGPLEIPDDLRIYGLTEVMGGLINNGGAGGGGAGGGAAGGGTPAAPILTVAVTGDTPTCSSVTKGTSGNSVTKLSFTAGGGDVKISSLIFTRGGTATENDIDNISIMDATTNTVVPSSVVNNPGDKTKYLVTFSSPVSVVVGTPVNLIVRTAIKSGADSGKTFYFGVNSNAEVVANKLGSAAGTDPVTAGGTFPMKGNTCTIGASAPSATPSLIMSPVNPVSVAVSTTPTTVTITLSSEAANTSSTIVNTTSVNIKNNQHPERTFDITLTETNTNTHIFTSTFALNTLAGTYKPNASPKVMEIEMCNDNSIYGRYPTGSGSAQAGYTLIAHPNPPVCGTGSGTIIDVGGPGTVEAVTLLNSDFAETSPIALFGSFIPTAYAANGFPEPDSGAAGSELLHPVTVFDDLYVFGNGTAEPGNAVINGFLRAGQDGLTSQISGNLNLLGALVTVSDDLEVLGDLTVSNSVTVSTGDLTLTAGSLNVGNELDVTGHIDANTAGISGGLTAGSVTAGSITSPIIGRMYKVDYSTTHATAGTKTTTASCASGDILISCSGRQSSSTSSAMLGTEMDSIQCKTSIYKSNTSSITLYSQAMCFDPDRSGTVSSAPGTVTELM